MKRHFSIVATLATTASALAILDEHGSEKFNGNAEEPITSGEVSLSTLAGCESTALALSTSPSLSIVPTTTLLSKAVGLDRRNVVFDESGIKAGVNSERDDDNDDEDSSTEDDGSDDDGFYDGSDDGNDDDSGEGDDGDDGDDNGDDDGEDNGDDDGEGDNGDNWNPDDEDDSSIITHTITHTSTTTRARGEKGWTSILSLKTRHPNLKLVTLPGHIASADVGTPSQTSEPSFDAPALPAETSLNESQTTTAIAATINQESASSITTKAPSSTTNKSSHRPTHKSKQTRTKTEGKVKAFYYYIAVESPLPSYDLNAAAATDSDLASILSDIATDTYFMDTSLPTSLRASNMGMAPTGVAALSSAVATPFTQGIVTPPAGMSAGAGLMTSPMGPAMQTRNGGTSQGVSLATGVGGLGGTSGGLGDMSATNFDFGTDFPMGSATATSFMSMNMTQPTQKQTGFGGNTVYPGLPQDTGVIVNSGLRVSPQICAAVLAAAVALF